MKADVVVKRKVRPFSLGEVTLLDGPFKHAMDLNRSYLLALEPDRLLARFREYAALSPKAVQYGGWEAESLSGHTLGHYLSAISMMYASLGEEDFKQRVDYVTDELETCQNAHGDGYVSGIPRGREVFEEVAGGDIRSKGFDLNGAWAPLYTLHKLFAGLRDAYRLTGNRKALDVERKLADWLAGILMPLSEDQMEEMMICEYGGMNEVLVDLYADTGEVSYLKLAQKFWHKQVLDPLSKHVDSLSGKHANTQIPKLIGLAKEYELTNDLLKRETTEFFWDRVVNHHSYVIGGNSFGEYFGDPNSLNDRLGPHTTETCNTYNMLKLTKHLFEWSGNAQEADYYERALFNHILASQNPTTGAVTYCLSLAMGGHKSFDDKFEDFTCCVGTGMENHASYGSAIYFEGEESLYVNQFIPSKLDWKHKGMTLVQTTNYPTTDQSNLKICTEEPVSFSLFIRYPYWAKQGIEIRINGEKIEVNQQPGSFICLNRTWVDEDQVDITIPMSLWMESMPDNPDRAAILYGPLVLAGVLGPVDDPAVTDYLYTPVMIAKDKPMTEWIVPVTDNPLTFRTKGIGAPRDVELIPFYQIYDKSYSVYWDFFTTEGWKKAESEYTEVMRKIKLLEQCTVDYVQPGEMQPERDHNFQGDSSNRVGLLNRRTYRTAGQEGWFSFDLSINSTQPMMLVATFTSAQELPNSDFDILIDGERLTLEQQGFEENDKFYNVHYPLSADLLAGKEKVTIKFQGKKGRRIRRLFGLRMVNQEQYKRLGEDA
ncbi:glycoside hydrolase family 127 protein [Paenibacillus sp. R14(2021)]|uniref:glycoside hydrolase family 127 protein n=1 Tax=Paenibacillus sp. R14(2021) TaxID=2859228 RepID=UPI001C6116B3|nr:glycoside hydrolase family 127 protein [Paenibacillus sp. R14(2021)]